jgi:hypothetical protein
MDRIVYFRWRGWLICSNVHGGAGLGFCKKYHWLKKQVSPVGPNASADAAAQLLSMHSRRWHLYSRRRSCWRELYLLQQHIKDQWPWQVFDWRPSPQLAMWDTQRYSPYPLLVLLRATCLAAIRPLIPTVLGLEASDPRDKIYGILGLAADRD